MSVLIGYLVVGVFVAIIGLLLMHNGTLIKVPFIPFTLLCILFWPAYTTFYLITGPAILFEQKHFNERVKRKQDKWKRKMNMSKEQREIKFNTKVTRYKDKGIIK